MFENIEKKKLKESELARKSLDRDGVKELLTNVFEKPK